MDNETKFWATIWSIVGICAVFLALVIGSCERKLKKTYVDAGYEQVSALGQDVYLWQKANCP